MRTDSEGKKMPLTPDHAEFLCKLLKTEGNKAYQLNLADLLVVGQKTDG